jgi:hypothetical protein
MKHGLPRVLLLALALIPALSTAAAAKPGYVVFKRQQSAFLQLPASNGYLNQISASRRRVELIAFRFKSGSIDYRVVGRLDGGRLHASFGRFGRVAMRFQPAGPPQPEPLAPPTCNGKSATRQEGHFVGSVRFRSETGLIAVRERSVKATVFNSYRLVCPREQSSRQTGGGFLQKGYSLLARSRGRPAAPVFAVFKEDPRQQRTHYSSEDANYSASATERRGRLTVTRSATVTAAPETFAVEPLGAKPASASVSPPPPFSGTAHAERGSDAGTTWTGDLAVELPELGTVPLTGGDYQASLCRGFKCSCPSGKCAYIFFTAGRRQLAYDPLRNIRFSHDSLSQFLDTHR